ncbi:MAG: ACP S-malonyltransferase [Coriobacteriales bacterium]|nr:ACP S-malonyltransferase [Coriobacteriales bacterium]
MAARTALVFPGQGSQRPGMIEAIPELDSLDRLLDAAEALSGLELRTVAALGGAEDLADTRVAQPLLYLADWAWGITLLDSGVEPVAVAGHSLGELAALAVAGVYSVEAGLELVVERSKLMAAVAASTPGTMAAVLGLDAEVIAQTADGCGDIWVANDNSPGQVVISGTHQGITHATKLLTEAGARRIVELQVAGPFHSPLMEPAREAFESIVRAADFCDATIPVLQNTDPEPTTDAEAIRDRLVGQITAPVRWTEIMQRLAADGPITLIEAGPGSVLTGLARKMPDIRTFAVESTQLENIVEEVS